MRQWGLLFINSLVSLLVFDGELGLEERVVLALAELAAHEEVSLALLPVVIASVQVTGLATLNQNISNICDDS